MGMNTGSVVDCGALRRQVLALVFGVSLASGPALAATIAAQVAKANPAVTGFPPAAGGIGTPIPQSPTCGTELHNYPRVLNLVWTPAVSANRHEVEIDCLSCTQVGKWDSEVGASKHLGPLSGTSTTYTFPGDNDGRWRVRGMVLAGGGFNEHRYGWWSDWCKFSFKTGQRQLSPVALKPCVLRPCPDITKGGVGLVISGSGGPTTGHMVPWGASVTLGEAEAIVRSNGMCAFNIHYEMKNVGPAATAPAAPPVAGPRFTNRLLADGTAVSQQTDLYLPAGASQTIDTQAYLPTGTHALTLSLNDGFTILESDTTNNKVGIQYVLNGTCGGRKGTGGGG